MQASRGMLRRAATPVQQQKRYFLSAFYDIFVQVPSSRSVSRGSPAAPRGVPVLGARAG